MTMKAYQNKCGTEEACRVYRYEKRWPNGFMGPPCGHPEHVDLKSHNQ
jgi:hypothetical protein